MTLQRLIAAASIALTSLLAVPAFAQAPAPKTTVQPAVAAKPGKKTPARDPKTGRFVKSGDKMTAKPAASKSEKATPARDPKTGRFVKSADKAAAPKARP